MKFLLWLFLAVLTASYITGSISDPDLWWHIVAGRWILAHHSIPTQDYWNLFGVGQPWRAYSWSFEILVAWLDSFGDMHWLLAAKLCIALFVSLSFFYVFAKLASDWAFGALLGMYAAAATFNHFTLRPQSLVWAYFAWVLYFSDQIDRRGISKKPLLGLAVMMMLWANTHLSSVLGILLIAGWILKDRQDLRPVFLAAAAGIIGTLVTPYLGGEWATFISKTSHPFNHRSITEFQPATIMQHSTAFILIIAALIAVFAWKAGKSIAPAKFFTAGLFVAGALAIIKFIPFAVIVLCGVTAVLWREAGNDKTTLGNLGDALQKLLRLSDRIPKQGIIFVILVMTILNVRAVWRIPLDDEVVAVRAVDFVQKENLPLPLLHGFGDGGYVMYRFNNPDGSPRLLVPIDGRTNVVPENVWTSYLDALQGKETWKKYFDLVKPRTILWRTESPLVSILKERSDWCEVYRYGSERRGYVLFVMKESLKTNTNLQCL